MVWRPGAVPYRSTRGLRRRSQSCVSEARNGLCAAVISSRGAWDFLVESEGWQRGFGCVGESADVVR